MQMRGAFGNGGTSAHQPSESSDWSVGHPPTTFGAVIMNINKRSVSADARAFTPNYLLSVDLFNSKCTVEGQEPKRLLEVLVNSLKVWQKTKQNVTQCRSTEQRCSGKYDSLLSSRNSLLLLSPPTLSLPQKKNMNV